jgi:hypothetical protein
VPRLWQVEIHGDKGAAAVVVGRVEPQAHVPQAGALAGGAIVGPGEVHGIGLHLLHLPAVQRVLDRLLSREETGRGG